MPVQAERRELVAYFEVLVPLVAVSITVFLARWIGRKRQRILLTGIWDFGKTVLLFCKQMYQSFKKAFMSAEGSSGVVKIQEKNKEAMTELELLEESNCVHKLMEKTKRGQEAYEGINHMSGYWKTPTAVSRSKVASVQPWTSTPELCIHCVPQHVIVSRREKEANTEHKLPEESTSIYEPMEEQKGEQAAHKEMSGYWKTTVFSSSKVASVQPWILTCHQRFHDISTHINLSRREKEAKMEHELLKESTSIYEPIEKGEEDVYKVMSGETFAALPNSSKVASVQPRTLTPQQRFCDISSHTIVSGREKEAEIECELLKEPTSMYKPLEEKKGEQEDYKEKSQTSASWETTAAVPSSSRVASEAKTDQELLKEPTSICKLTGENKGKKEDCKDRNVTAGVASSSKVASVQPWTSTLEQQVLIARPSRITVPRGEKEPNTEGELLKEPNSICKVIMEKKGEQETFKSSSKVASVQPWTLTLEQCFPDVPSHTTESRREKTHSWAPTERRRGEEKEIFSEEIKTESELLKTSTGIYTHTEKVKHKPYNERNLIPGYWKTPTAVPRSSKVASVQPWTLTLKQRFPEMPSRIIESTEKEAETEHELLNVPTSIHQPLEEKKGEQEVYKEMIGDTHASVPKSEVAFIQPWRLTPEPRFCNTPSHVIVSRGEKEIEAERAAYSERLEKGTKQAQAMWTTAYKTQTGSATVPGNYRSC